MARSGNSAPTQSSATVWTYLAIIRSTSGPTQHLSEPREDSQVSSLQAKC